MKSSKKLAKFYENVISELFKINKYFNSESDFTQFLKDLEVSDEDIGASGFFVNMMYIGREKIEVRPQVLEGVYAQSDDGIVCSGYILHVNSLKNIVLEGYSLTDGECINRYSGKYKLLQQEHR